MLKNMGDAVALYEFRSKGNSLSRTVMEGLNEVIDHLQADEDLRGLIIGNTGKNFSVGADLKMILDAAETGAFDEIEEYIRLIQSTIQRVHYAAKPIVVAVHERVLGGGCELAMACSHPVALSETYAGLVETAVGLIPAGTGLMRLAARAGVQAADAWSDDAVDRLRAFEERILEAAVSQSAREAVEFGYLSPATVIVHDFQELLGEARRTVLQLAEASYPAPEEAPVWVAGKAGQKVLEDSVEQNRERHGWSDYDVFLAGQLAYVLTGGDVEGPEEVSEEYMLDLEREVFLRVVREPKSQSRIRHMLEEKEPLKN